MTHRPKNPTANVALRIATAMHQMGIDGLPRNYELVFEAYAGNNPDLVREFVALGRNKTQEALDIIGRKYLPHHQEEGLLSRQNGAMRSGMSTFISMLNEEKTSLAHYGRLIGEASEAIAANDQEGPLGRTITVLKQATDQRADHNSALVRTVTTQSAALADIQRETDQAEAAKFSDALTGLGNRRAFNKALSKIYADRSLPVLCGLAVGELDDAARNSDPLPDHLLRHVARVIQSVTGDDLACRFDGGRFGLLFYTAEQNEIVRLVELVNTALKSINLVNSEMPRPSGSLSMSFGICMSSQAGNVYDLVSQGEKALGASKAGASGSVTLYGAADPAAARKDWLLYRNGTL